MLIALRADVGYSMRLTPAPNLTARLRCKSELADDLNFQLDLIVQQPGRDLPIYRIAKRCGVPL